MLINYLSKCTVIIFILFNEIIAVPIPPEKDLDLWIIILNDGRSFNAIEVEFEKDSMLAFTDNYDLKRIIKVSEINLIKKIKNNGNFLDCIILKDGSKLCGNIIEYVPGNYINIILINLKNSIVNVENVAGFDREAVKIKSITEQSYFELGANLGFPAALNLIGGYHFGKLGFSISGSYVYIADGVQANISYSLYDDNIKRHAISFAGGNSNIMKSRTGSGGLLQNFHWEYLALTYNLYYNGFYGEIGWSRGNGNYDNPQIIFQFGFISRFLEQ